MEDYKEKYENILHDIDIAIAGQKEGETKIVLQNLKERHTESEDERIKKCIGMCLTDATEQRFEDFNTTLKDCLSWLEKQSEQKLEQEEDAELTDFESALFSAFSDAWQEYLSGKEVNVAKWAREHSAELLEVARKPNFCHHEVDFSGCSEEYRKAYYDGWNNCNQQHAQLEAEQKPSWSEEDENGFGDTLWAIKKARTIAKNENEMGNLWYAENWLNSLKERMKGE
jgi:hypothetical protein